MQVVMETISDMYQLLREFNYTMCTPSNSNVAILDTLFLSCLHAACYGREFGPKGVGFGQGAGTLSMS